MVRATAIGKRPTAALPPLRNWAIHWLLFSCPCQSLHADVFLPPPQWHSLLWPALTPTPLWWRDTTMEVAPNSTLGPIPWVDLRGYPFLPPCSSCITLVWMIELSSSQSITIIYHTFSINNIFLIFISISSQQLLQVATTHYRHQ